MLSVLHQNSITCECVTSLRLEFIPSSARSLAIEHWCSLEVELSNSSLTCSSIWIETWLKYYGEHVPHQFALGMRSEKVCGIVLITQGVDQNAGPIRLKTRHLGTAGELDSESVCVEYNDFLVNPEDRFEFLQLVWNWVEQKIDCDEFRMDGFDISSIAPLLPQTPLIQIERKPSYFFDLRESRITKQEPLKRLGSHTRERIRRTWREMGDVRGEWAESPSRAECLFLKMVEFHQARWNSVGMPGAYSSQRFRDFHLELIHRAVPLGLMALVGLSSADRLMGVSQVMIDKNRGLLYQCGWVPGVGKLSPGMALDYQCILECFDRGFDEVDFLAGNASHKKRLSTNHAVLAWVVWRRSSFKNSAINFLRQIKTQAKALLSNVRRRTIHET